MDIGDRKRVARRVAQERRRRVEPDTRSELAGMIAERILSLPEMLDAGSVLAYASFGNEVPTDPIIERLLADGRSVLLPYVDGRTLKAAPVRSLDEVAPGYRGIREPVTREPVEASADIVLVPGVAFDETGRRLGYGGGFYDALLVELPRRSLRIGLCFDVQILEEVPAGPSDQLVDVIVTETRIIRCGASAPCAR